MLSFKEFSLVNEGVHDKGIFHAVFLAGGPGSGKDFIMKKTLHGHGLTEINSDTAFEHLLKKHGLSKKMPESEREQRDVVRARGKQTTETKRGLSEMGRNGLIINGTGQDHEKVHNMKNHLESLGYKTHMLFVHTDNEVSKKRNAERARSLPESDRKEIWDKVNAAKQHYKKSFGNNYHEVDNTIDTKTAPDANVKAHNDKLSAIHKHFMMAVASKDYTPTAQKWIEDQKKR